MPWELSGNATTNPPSDFLGTIDDQPLIIKTNGIERVRIESDGTFIIPNVLRTEKGDLNIYPENDVDEGGQITLRGAGTNTDVFIDNLSGDLRIITIDGHPIERIRVTKNGTMKVNGIVESNGGYRFPDGSLQITATLRGPAGRDGKDGKDGSPGPAVKTVAVCSGDPCRNVCRGKVVAQASASPVCHATSDTGACQANYQGGWCCVCAP